MKTLLTAAVECRFETGPVHRYNWWSLAYRGYQFGAVTDYGDILDHVRSGRTPLFIAAIVLEEPTP